MNNQSILTILPASADPSIITEEIKSFLSKKHARSSAKATQEVVIHIKVAALPPKKAVDTELAMHLKALEQSLISLSKSKAAYAEAKVIRSMRTYHTVEVVHGIKSGKNRCRRVSKYRFARNFDGTIKNRVRLSTEI
jgi:hypothetical protein